MKIFCVCHWLQLLWSAATTPPCPLCILRVLGTRRTRYLQMSFLHLCPPGSLTYFGRIFYVGPSGLSRCTLETSRCWSVDSDAPLFAQTSNNEVSNQLNLCNINKRPLGQRISVHGLLAHNSIGKKYSWYTVLCYSTVASAAFRWH